MATSAEQRNMELMQTLDDAWNAQDVKVFRERPARTGSSSRPATSHARSRVSRVRCRAQ
jgi:hypothetical protein